MKHDILIIEDDIAMAETIKAYLSNSKRYEITVTSSAQEGLEAFGKKDYSAVLLDLNLPDQYGLDILKTLTANNEDCAIIVLTGETSMTIAVDAMKKGAHDFVTKPITPERLRISVKNAIERSQLTEIAQTYKKISRKNFQSFIGQSPKMQAIYNILENAAHTDAPVFITGEAGTGKEMTARAIHMLSNRSAVPFEILNCKTLPRHLFETELFGSGQNILKKANNGILFIHEITHMPTAIQLRLLALLQHESLNKESFSIPDIRIITATTSNPLAAIQNGYLNESLYYRLNIIPVHMPRLSARGRDDILLLAHHFIKMISRDEGKEFNIISPDAEKMLIHHQWPNNVRELEQLIRSIILTNKGSVIEAEMINFQSQDTNMTKLDNNSFLPHSEKDIKTLDEYERDIIQAAIKACYNNITKAAKRLDINPATIHRKQKQWDTKNRT